MPIDPTADQATILAAIVTAASSVPVVESFADGQLLPVKNGVPQDYVVVDFGSPVGTVSGRSIAPGEQAQPTSQRVIVSSVSLTKAHAREMTNDFTSLAGFKASSNTGELRLVGGGGFPVAATQAGRPVMYAQELFLLWSANMDPTLT